MIEIIRPLNEVEQVGANSIFLAGPTYRIPEDQADTWHKPSWRAAAIQFLEDHGFDGQVFYPEWENNLKPYGWSYEKQVAWENNYLNTASVILFYIPRDLELLPGFTTNIEFGEWMHSGKIIVGFPNDAPKTDYIKEKCNVYNIPVENSIEDTVVKAMDMLYNQALKHIWFISDTHFGSERALTLSRRPFSSVKEMDLEIIKNWNSKISPKDDVFHLGDFGDFNILPYLNYNTFTLIKGNYEKEDGDLSEVLLQYDFELKERDHLSVFYTGVPVELILVHEPEKYDPEYLADNNPFWLYGHIHGRQTCKKWGMDVGVDAHHFYPINAKDVLWWKNAIDNHYDNNVFI